MISQPFFPPRDRRPPLDFVLAEYPFPVAVAYARLQAEMERQEPVAAAWQLLDAFQCALKFCACVAVADQLQAAPQGPTTAELVARLFKPLSLGDWQALLEDALRSLKDAARRGALAQSGRCVPELYAVFFRPNGQRTDVARKLFDGQPNLVKWRNEVFGHGVFRHDRAFYAAEVNRWRHRLDELLQALRPVLSAWSLVGRTPGGEQVNWTGAGNVSPAKPHAHQPWGDPLPLQLVPRAAPDRGLDLGPLLTVQQCLVSRQPSSSRAIATTARKTLTASASSSISPATVRICVRRGHPEGEPDLASALNNLGNALRDQGEFAAACAAYLEALAICRRLVRQRRVELEPYLAKTLTNLGTALQDQGELAKAIAAEREAINLYRRLIPAGHPELESALALALNKLGNALSDQNDRAGALAAFVEAIDIFRRLVVGGRVELEHHLAIALTDRGNALEEHSPDALAAQHEAVSLCRRLVESGHVELEDELASVLYNLGNGQLDQRELPAAIAAYREAIPIQRRLVERGRTELESDLANALHNQAVALDEQGDQPGAIDAYREALNIRRRQVQSGHAGLEDDLAMVLVKLGSALADQGELAEAGTLYREAILIGEGCVERCQLQVLPPLLGAYGMHLSLLARQRDWNAAADTIRTVLRRRDSLFPGGNPPPEGFNDVLDVLRTLGSGDRQTLFAALGEDAARLRGLLGEM